MKNNIQTKLNLKLIKITKMSKVNYFGRANSAIWCIASYLKKTSKKRAIILPSTMCVSPAIIFFINNFNLLFVDVEKTTGLMNIPKALKLINSRDDIAACFYINLFGNKDRKSAKLKNNKKNVLIIQDLAQTFFHKKKNSDNDLFGDLIILSFGYSKIFDLDHGGIILSNNSYLYEFGNEFDKQIKNKKIIKKGKIEYLKWYKKIFIDNKKINLNELKRFSKKIYLIKFDKKKLIKIFKSVNLISSEFKKRKYLLNNYKKYSKNLDIKLLHSKSYMMPWRFSFLIKKNRDIFLNEIRKNGYDASSYYPNIGKRFTRKSKIFSNSDLIEENIVNLWLTKNYNVKKVIEQTKILKKNLK